MASPVVGEGAWAGKGSAGGGTGREPFPPPAPFLRSSRAEWETGSLPTSPWILVRARGSGGLPPPIRGDFRERTNLPSGSCPSRR